MRRAHDGSALEQFRTLILPLIERLQVEAKQQEEEHGGPYFTGKRAAIEGLAARARVMVAAKRCAGADADPLAMVCIEHTPWDACPGCGAVTCYRHAHPYWRQECRS